MQLLERFIAFSWLVALIALLVNGLVLLFSPREYFALADWTRARGTLTGRQFASGSGAVRLRLLGAILVAGTSWFLFAAYRSGTQQPPPTLPASVSVVGSILPGILATGAALIALFNGSVMLISPLVFFKLPNWIRLRGVKPHFWPIGLRILGAVLVGGALVMIWTTLMMWINASEQVH